MLKIISERIKQGFRTIDFPKKEAPAMPDRYLGRPIVLQNKCQKCKKCVDICPTGALSFDNGLSIDLSRCIFCGKCVEGCLSGAIIFTRDFRMATTSKEALILNSDQMKLAEMMGNSLKRVLGRSLMLREVSAGGCNGCELDVNVLTTIGYDLSRFGIQFVASPRHADGLFITGPITENMKLAVEKTYLAIPSPKIVIASGACALSGGPYINLPSCLNGASTLFKVDLFIPGCPPHPLTILDGLLRLLGNKYLKKLPTANL